MPISLKLFLTGSIVWLICGILYDVSDDPKRRAINSIIIGISLPAVIVTISSFLYFIWGL